LYIVSVFIIIVIMLYNTTRSPCYIENGM